jgi:hypothetical protein
MQKTRDYYTPKTMPTVDLGVGVGGVVLYFGVNYIESPLGPALRGGRIGEQSGRP